MTEKWLPQTGISLSADEVVNMWRKDGVNQLGGLTITQDIDGITVSSGYTQIDGVGYKSIVDTHFTIDKVDDVTYFVFLVSNRTDDIVVDWKPLTPLMFPDNLLDYDGINAIPAMSSRLAVGFMADFVLYDPIEATKLTDGIYQEVGGLYIQPLWASRNDLNYYYPKRYNHTDVLWNLYRGVGGLNIENLVLDNFSIIEFDTAILSLDGTDTDILFRLQPINFTNPITSNIRMDGVDITSVSTDTGFFYVPVSSGFMSCQVSATLRKFEGYLFVHMIYRWDTGEVNIVTGQFYFGQHNYSLHKLEIGLVGTGTNVGSNMQARIR